MKIETPPPVVETPVTVDAPPAGEFLAEAAPATVVAPAIPPPFPPAAPKAAGASLASLLDEPASHQWYRRPALWIALALVLLVAAGIWYWQVSQAASAAPSYITQTVARGNLTLTVTANGTLQPTRAISIGSELSGTVLKVNVDVNDRIKKGQVLVELDTAKLRDQIVRSRASVAAANAKVEQNAATIKETAASLARFEEVARLSGGKVPSKAELDGARATLARAKADGAGARAGVTDAQAALSTDEINLSKASIRAPSDGVVLTRSVDPGNAVAASLQAVTLFTVAEDLSQLRLQVYVDEADVGTVAIGQKASFTVSAYAGRRYPAEITRVAFGSTITDNVVTYLTYLGVDNTDLSLRPGMTATATITATQRKDVLLVPNSALRFSPASAPGAAAGGGAAKTAAKGGIVASLVPRMPRGNTRGSAPGGGANASRQVWVLRDDVAVAVAVTPGISDGRMTEITGGELEAGMQVITDQKTAAAK
ncbi:MAG: efflux RND transporter periplasmic adaptor subunit [Betaproteobacteria bacterium]